MKYLLALPAGILCGMILTREYLAGRHQIAIELVLVGVVTLIMALVSDKLLADYEDRREVSDD
jgi:hypothetical protein